MLTLPSEPLPQIVLSMDGDPPFCSAPPHSDPLPLPTVTGPSFVNYGLSASRRSGRLLDSPRKNHVTERRTAQKPYNKPNPSATTRERATPNMVQLSQSVPSRVERTPEKDPRNEERLDFGVASESINDKLKRPNISKKPRLSPLKQTLTEQQTHIFSKTASNPLETCSLPAPDTAPKGWVIGPLFQSFRSKMASFTEIVMSPVKLFKSNSVSDNEPHSDEPSNVENPKESCTSEEEDHRDAAQANQQTDLKQLSVKCVNNLLYGDDKDDKDDLDAEVVSVVVPLQTPKPELEFSVTQSASNSSKIFKFVEEESVSWSVRTRKQQNRATPKAAPVTEVGSHELKQNNVDDKEFNNIHLTKPELEIKPESDCIKDCLDESQADKTPTSRAILDDASLKKVKRTLNLSGQTGETGKRKKMAAKTQEVEEEAVVRVDLSSSLVQKRKPKRKEVVVEEEETRKGVRKSVTRVNKKFKVEQEGVLILNNDSNLNTAPVSLVDKSSGGQRSAKSKAKMTQRTKGKVDASLDLQTSVVVMSKIENKQPPEVLAPPSDTKRSEKGASKKRKAKEQLSMGLDIGACPASSEVAAEENKTTDMNDKKEDSGKSGHRLKKTKTDTRKTVVSEVVVKRGRSKNATEKVYFEMTPSENNVQDVSLASQSLQSDAEVRESGLPKRRTRRVDPQRRRCRVVHSRTRKGDEGVNSVTLDDTDLFKKGCSTRLLRSYSCPEIPVLRLHETPWTPPFHSPPRSRSQPAQHHQHQHHSAPSTSSSSLAHHFHRSPRRARRHTVCSVEVEREIAPLCLRKEVYPTRRSPSPYDPSQHHSPVRALSPGASLTPLASCFLSSPLAFLSKKFECGRSGMSSPIRTLSPVVSTAPSLTSLLGSSMGQLPGFHLRTDSLLNASTSDSSISSVSGLVCEPEQPPQSEEDDEDTSSSSHESEDLGLREEKALSDSEVKVVKKDEGQRKVSSIKIRKALPKPQNNLTPMGLPKQVRVKKKEFSLEEIYTNKNFSKPPESRLETIFEVPLSRKNGSETWFGQRRTKRFLEFLEVGEARKPKKPLVGAAKVTSANSRTRRGNKEDAPLNPLDLDSVLCAKLEQLSVWLSDNDQRDS